MLSGDRKANIFFIVLFSIVLRVRVGRLMGLFQSCLNFRRDARAVPGLFMRGQLQNMCSTTSTHGGWDENEALKTHGLSGRADDYRRKWTFRYESLQIVWEYDGLFRFSQVKRKGICQFALKIPKFAIPKLNRIPGSSHVQDRNSKHVQRLSNMYQWYLGLFCCEGS